MSVDNSTLKGGTMQYALGEDETTAPTDGWDEAVPNGKNVGTYYVWYKAYVKAWIRKNGKKTYVRTSPVVHAYTSGAMVTSRCMWSRSVSAESITPSNRLHRQAA